MDGHLHEWTKELVDQARAEGVKVYVDVMGTTDNAEGYRRAVSIGVDGIQTDYPDRLLQFLGSPRAPEGGDREPRRPG